MELAEDLIARHFDAAGGELHIGGLPISQVVAEHGTPLFVYSGEVLERACDRLRRTFPEPRFAICYSVKANPNPSILRWFVRRVWGLEVASAGEIARAVRAGCSPDRIVFAGPGKTERELEYALVQGIGELHVESVLEVQRVRTIAGRLGIRAGVALRVNPAAGVQGGAMRMGGKPAPFGIDEEQLDEAVDMVASSSSLDFRGLHLFTGTQILDHEALLRQYRKGLDLGLRVSRRLQRPLATLDFGGGLGIPYFPGDHPLDMEALANGLVGLTEEADGEPLLRATRFVIEPGRYLVGEAGIYVTRVNDIKVSRGKTFVIVDGGMHHYLAASGNLGQVIKRTFPMTLLNKLGKEPGPAVDVVGPLCTPLDTVGRDAPLPGPEVGDLLGIFQAGAYGLTASPTNFLSHSSPAEVFVSKGRAHEIRRRGK